MKDLNKLVNECMNELDVIGIPYSENIVEFTVNTRAKRRWGQCRKRNGKYFINISDRILDENVADDKTKNTIIHEILHTCKGCMNHGTEWQKWCDLVNDCYACYNITRTTSASSFGLEPYKRSNYKYMYKCKYCGQIIKRARKSNFTDFYYLYGCGLCGNKKAFVEWE